MKTKELEMQCQGKEQKTIRWKIWPSVALLWALLGSPSESYAQSMHNVDDVKDVMEITQPDSVSKKDVKKPIWIVMTWDGWIVVEPESELDDDGVKIEPDPEWGDWEIWWGEIQDDWWDESVETQKHESGIKLHGCVQAWTSVVPDIAEVCSDKLTMVVCADVSHPKTWLWFTVVRMDDFTSDPEYLASRATVLNPHWTRSLLKGKASISLEWKYTIIDHLSEAGGFAPDILWSYRVGKWWAFEWMYSHSFKKWPDSDFVRLWITKKINDALSLTAQWWYKSDYEWKFFGRIIADINLWNGLWVQLSCIAKNWKLIPTAGVLYRF